MASQNEAEGGDFAQLLSWLDPDPDVAGEKYRLLHGRLVALFGYWRCLDQEGLADDALGRTARKVHLLRGEGDSWGYIRRIAWNVRREDVRRRSRALSLDERDRRLQAAPFEAADELGSARAMACLRKCRAEVLSQDETRLIAEYYDDSDRVAQRKALARELGVSAATLRKRSERCRRRLGQCLRLCLGRGEGSHRSG